MIDVAYLFLITSTALLMGNEFSIAAFIHPSLARKNHRRFLPAIQVFARLFGRIMPFWMAGTLLLHLALTWALWTSHPVSAGFTLSAAIVWASIVAFSVILPVPINNRVASWDPSNLPPGWEADRKRWDYYNAVRVALIGMAFILLLLAYKNAN